MGLYDGFVNRYSVSKTLRFELIPQGRTREYIETNGILSDDEERAKDYKTIKRLIDEYHKDYISRCLKNVNISCLEEYYHLYNSSNRDKRHEELDALSDQMRGEIASFLTGNDEYKEQKSRDIIINERIINFASTDEELAAVKRFRKFTSYFTGFFTNRENMYSAEKKSTAIAHRIIDVNLPKYVDNIKAFNTAIEAGVFDIAEFESNFKAITDEHEVSDLLDITKYSRFIRNEDIIIYNTLLGGISMKDEKIQGLNELINLHNQKHPGKKVPLLKVLYKQILGDSQTHSFVDDQFEDDQQVINAVKAVTDTFSETLLGSLKIIINNIGHYDLDRIYIKAGQDITTLSKRALNDWHIITECLESEYDDKFPKNKKSDTYEEMRNRYVKSFKSFSIGRLNSLVTTYTEQACFLENYLGSFGGDTDKNCLTDFTNSLMEVEHLLNSEYPVTNRLITDYESVRILKRLLDSEMEVIHFLKPLLGNGNESDKDLVFYGEFEAEYEKLLPVIKVYNRVRNYLTRKPFSTEKIKLNFNSPTLLCGWSQSKEKEYMGVILRKDGQYYLGIMTPSNKKIFSEAPKPDEDCYEKMVLRYIPHPYQMLPKVFFSKSNIAFFNPSDEILRIKKQESFKKGKSFNRDDCHKFIDFYKDSINRHEEWRKFNFKFSDTDSYEDISRFYKEVENQAFSMSFTKIPTVYIDSLVDEGKLYLFKLHNKDFSEHSKGKPNLHTVYWNALFSEYNLQNTVYQLNGSAEIFFRKASIPENERVIHKKNVPITRKVAELNGKKEVSVFPYDIIKNRRYTVDKFQFHVPLKMNFKADEKKRINDDVIEAIRSNKGIHVIGIDRGERNLLYLSLINEEGRIIEQRSLNIIDSGEGHTQNYRDLLDSREKDREKARENWQEIQEIKDLKTGYLSQAIHTITKWMKEYNAIIVLEDLNDRFTNGRKKVEKQVYQKFEKMLIDKLNYYVDKDEEFDRMGGTHRALQLTEKFESFQKLGRQTGFIFYVPAWNTSKLDPTTGFVDLLYPKYKSVDATKDFIKKFDFIRFNSEKNYFEFGLHYSNFTERAIGCRDEWILCSYGNRIVNFRNAAKNNSWDYKEIDITKQLLDLFEKNGIDVKQENLIDSICEMKDKPFFKSLIANIKLILQIRNSASGTDIDYMISPAMNDRGEFFDTRKGLQQLPLDADANGAYNIAKKGLWIVDQIRNTTGNNVKMAMSNREWMHFAQESRLA